MDPATNIRQMIYAMASGKLEDALELALNLNKWKNRGGFFLGSP